MCKAFSCVVMKSGAVLWKWAVNSHEQLMPNGVDRTEDPEKMQVCRVEITPENEDYLFPDKWVLHVDEKNKPAWWTELNEKHCFEAHTKWLKKLDKILVRKQIVHPFRIDPPNKITKKHISILKKWDSVCDSVSASVYDSVRASVSASVSGGVRASVYASVYDSVYDSVRASVSASVSGGVRASVSGGVRDSVCAIYGALFCLPRSSWKYTENIKTKGYPFQPCVDLWEQGLVPSFDGKMWRLHGGPDGKVLFEISKEELEGR